MRINIKFTNRTATPIYVVMDNGRESHQIPAAGAVTFGPNVGDNPTYHVHNVDPKTGAPTGEIYSDTFLTVRMTWTGPRVGGDLAWTGTEIVRD